MKIVLFDSGLGLLSFVRLILKKNYSGEFYLLLDNDHFPYGDKDDDSLACILEDIFFEVKKINADYLFICCNTMSRIYHKYSLKSDFKVVTILDINLSHYQPDFYLFGTKSLCNLNEYKTYSGENLAYLIENNQIKDIVKLLKIIDKKIILSCTHYLLLKPLLDYYHINYQSYEEEIFLDLKTDLSSKIYIKRKDFSRLKKFLNCRIYFY